MKYIHITKTAAGNLLKQLSPVTTDDVFIGSTAHTSLAISHAHTRARLWVSTEVSVKLDLLDEICDGFEIALTDAGYLANEKDNLPFFFDHNRPMSATGHEIKDEAMVSAHPEKPNMPTDEYNMHLFALINNYHKAFAGRIGAYVDHVNSELGKIIALNNQRIENTPSEQHRAALLKSRPTLSLVS